jgi:hypothetical protein
LINYKITEQINRVDNKRYKKDIRIPDFLLLREEKLPFSSGDEFLDQKTEYAVAESSKGLQN